MLKHGRVYPRKKGWTMRYLGWLQEQTFDYPAHQIVLQEMVDAVRLAEERVERLEQTIAEFLPHWSLAPLVRALQALRGVDLIVAVTFVTEVGDVSRFENPRQLMAYLGLVPGERSTGETVRDHQGRERSGSAHAGGKRLDLPSPAAHWQSQTLPAGGDDAEGTRDRLEGSDAPERPLSSSQWKGQEDNGGVHVSQHRIRTLEPTTITHVMLLANPKH